MTENLKISRRDALSGAAASAATIAIAGASGQAVAADQPSMSTTNEPAIHNNRIKQSICEWCYKNLSLDELCRIAVKLGYKGIDLVKPEDFPTLKKYGLIASMTPSHTIVKGLNHKENWDECLAAIRTSIDATAQAGYSNVICFSGNRAGMDNEEGLKNCTTAIKQIMGNAEKNKITLCMELLNSKVNHPDYMCDHSSWGVALVKSVGSDNFKLLYDIYHMQIMEGDVIATIRDFHQYFGHYHTGGVPGRHEIDETQELNYPAIVNSIVATGYKGWIAQEFIPVHDPAASLAQAAKACDV